MTMSRRFAYGNGLHKIFDQILDNDGQPISYDFSKLKDNLPNIDENTICHIVTDDDDH